MFSYRTLLGDGRFTGVTTVSWRLTCDLSLGYNSLNIYRRETINGLTIVRGREIPREVFSRRFFWDQRFSGLE